MRKDRKKEILEFLDSDIAIWKKDKYEEYYNRSTFLQDKFLNFILNFKDDLSDKQIEEILEKIKEVLI